VERGGAMSFKNLQGKRKARPTHAEKGTIRRATPLTGPNPTRMEGKKLHAWRRPKPLGRKGGGYTWEMAARYPKAAKIPSREVKRRTVRGKRAVSSSNKERFF